MTNTEQELLKLLREVWDANSRCFPDGRKFDEDEFLAFTPQERAIYLQGVSGAFIGRGEGLRPLMEGGFIRMDFSREFRAVVQRYWKEVAEGG